MTITEHIAELLHQHDCVVVPGWGGFLARRHPARMVHGTNKMLPPSKRVAFNQALQSDDGLLANRLSVQLDLPYAKALEMIQAYVVAGHQTLHNDRFWKLDGIGTFYLSSENLLQFNYDIAHNFSLAAFGLEAVNLPHRIAVAVPLPNELVPEETPVPLESTPVVVRVGLVQPWLRIAAMLAFAAFIGLLENWPLQPRMNQAGFNMLEWFTPTLHSTQEISSVPNKVYQNGVLAGDSTYYLIAGRYASIQDAGEAVKQLKAHGFPAELTIKVDGFTCVSALKSGTKTDLEQAVGDIRHLMNQDPSVLVLRRIP